MSNIAAVVEQVKKSCPYWAPEIRSRKLIQYLDEYGEPLFDALKALPDEEREAIGIDLITRKVSW